MRAFWRLCAFLLSIVGILAVLVLGYLFVGLPKRTTGVTYGATFSWPYAQSLGLDPKHTLDVALDDIGIRHFRIPAYWDMVEPTQGAFDFSTLDEQLNDISAHHGTVTLAVGRKLPRWPECWDPDWFKPLSTADRQKATLAYIEAVVDHERDNPAITGWQVENEPNFQYGDCTKDDPAFLKQEIDFVKSLDPTRPVATTDSGELSTWLRVGGLPDTLGVSTYRIVRNPVLGKLNIHWFLPPYFYERKAKLLSLFGVKPIYVSEFQMEPWSSTDLPHTAIDDQLSNMNVKQMQDNFWYAEHMQLPEVDFWGIEWWVWMAEQHNHPEFLKGAEQFWKSHTP